MGPSIGKVFGEAVARHLQARGENGTVFALKAGLSQPSVSHLIRGVTADPPLSSCVKVADALGVTIDSLLGREPPATPSFQSPASESDDAPDDVMRAMQLLLRGQAEMLKMLYALMPEPRASPPADLPLTPTHKSK